ncbi:hypothetical protein AX14_005395 [Amanita brunnescens Koide BX004]|nr:hypothetical protein AX14_005395 [Amanita brunnescens Koide BX004]
MDGTTHLKTSSRSSISDIAAHLWVGETPSAGVLERSEERSVVARPAIKQALTSSSKVEERQRFLRTVVNKINGKKREMCAPVDNAALSPRKSVLISSTTAPHAYLATDKDVLANSVVLTPASSSPRTPHVTIPDDVETCQGVSRMAQQVVEALTRLETATLWSGMIPSANGIERSSEHSNAIIGPAVEQTLAFISSEVGEKRQMPDAVVSAHIRKRGVTCSPSHSAAFTQPMPAPAAPSVPHMHAIALYQWPDESVPPLEVVSRQHEPSVISEASEANEVHLPSSQTAQKQSSFPESTVEKVHPIPGNLFSLSMRNKAREPSFKTVLDRQPLKRSSLADRVPANGVVPVSAPSNHSEGHVSAKGSADEINVSSGKGLIAARHSPVSKKTPTLRKAMPSVSLRALPASSKDGASLFSKLHIPDVIAKR